MAAEELSPDDIMALAEAFAPGPPSVALLTMAGFPRYAIPWARDLNALEFWSAVAEQVAAGVMPDGRTKLLASARRKYPYNPKFAPAPASAPAAGAAAADRAAGRTVPLRVLVIGASPADVPPVRADRESRKISEAALRGPGPGPGRMDVKYVAAAQATDLENVGSFRPDILHFITHGEDGCLLFNDVLGESDPVKASRVADTLAFYRDSASVRLRAIVLAACDGNTLAPFFTGVAETVIGHRGKLPDPCGVAFAEQLYRRLNDTDDMAAAAREAAQLAAQFSEGCAQVIGNLIVLPESG